MVLITSYLLDLTGVFKPTYNWWGPHCRYIFYRKKARYLQGLGISSLQQLDHQSHMPELQKYLERNPFSRSWVPMFVTSCIAREISGLQLKESQWISPPCSQCCQCGRLACCSATRSALRSSGGSRAAPWRKWWEGRLVQFLGFLRGNQLETHGRSMEGNDLIKIE